MPAQQISQPNPPPDPSLLPDSILDYAVELDTKDYLSSEELDGIRKFRRAADYIAAGQPSYLLLIPYSLCSLTSLAMIFLNDSSSVLLENDLTHDNIKPRLLGHWGTCPGLVMVYAHLNRIIRKTGLEALYVVGPGPHSNINLRYM